MKRTIVARIDEDRCIGCTRCIEACPVDAIVGAHQLMHTVVEPWCIGCALCERWCPWDAIDMVDSTEIAVHVADKGGPPDYVERNGPRLVAVAQSLADLAAEQRAAKK